MLSCVTTQRLPIRRICKAGLQKRIHQNETELYQLQTSAGDSLNQEIEPEEAIAARKDFNRYSDTLRPREQQRILLLLVRRIEFDAIDNSISINFHDLTTSQEPIPC